MKHEEISLITRKSLSESLKRAMEKKPFRKITVSELIQDCNINRKTFYYHFEDIYALLKWTFEEEAIKIVKHFNLLVDYEEAITFIMDYVEQSHYIMNCAHDPIVLDELKRFLYADFLEIVVSIIDGTEKTVGKNLDTGYKEFLSMFYTEAIAGVLIDWIKHREKRDSKTIIPYISNTIRESLIAIIKNDALSD